MPVHDWTKVPAGIFHDFHHGWIFAIKDALNKGLLPAEYYALAEQYAGTYGPDVLTLQAPAGSPAQAPSQRNGGATTLAKPRRKPVAKTEMEFYRSKQKMITVRHVSDDEIIALLEIVSPGNKSHRGRFREFIEKAAWFLDQRVQLSIIDLFPPSSRDPNGVHGAIWKAISDEPYALPRGKKNRTIVSYECGMLVQAYVEHVGVGDKLRDMTLFLEYDGCVEVPLEKTYQQAFDAVPKRWRAELIG